MALNSGGVVRFSGAAIAGVKPAAGINYLVKMKPRRGK